MRVDRRGFLQQTTAIALASRLNSLGSKVEAAESASLLSETPRFPIVDAHQHLWDCEVLDLAWIKSSETLNRSFTSRDYLLATEGLPIAKAVYMEVAASDDELAKEAEYAISVAKLDDNPTVAAVIGGRPGTEPFRAYIDRFGKSPYVKGVRRILHKADLTKGFHLGEPFLRDIRLLGEMGLRFDLNVPNDALEEGAKLVDRCPDTPFILNHCGNADLNWYQKPRQDESIERWRRGIAELAQRKHVTCKISGIIARAPSDWTPADLAPVVNHCLDTFGPDRVAFASDWPVCLRGATLRQWVFALQAIVKDRPEPQQRKLWHDNAVRIYGLA
ncbi:MAG: amidohydrolase family protein [Rhodopirellula sp.]|nr:amidohydrolase family protein [Rhodopirellula sp.]